MVCCLALSVCVIKMGASMALSSLPVRFREVLGLVTCLADAPTGLALDTVQQRLYVGCRNERLMVLDAVDGTLLGSVPIGKGVDACAFDLTTGFAFASCGDDTLTVLREEPKGTFRVVEQAKTHQGTRTMTLDPETHAVYLAAADFEPAPASPPGTPRTRPKIVPSTFAIFKFVR